MSSAACGKVICTIVQLHSPCSPYDSLTVITCFIRQISVIPVILPGSGGPTQ